MRFYLYTDFYNIGQGSVHFCSLHMYLCRTCMPQLKGWRRFMTRNSLECQQWYELISGSFLKLFTIICLWIYNFCCYLQIFHNVHMSLSEMIYNCYNFTFCINFQNRNFFNCFQFISDNRKKFFYWNRFRSLRRFILSRCPFSMTIRMRHQLLRFHLLLTRRLKHRVRHLMMMTGLLMLHLHQPPYREWDFSIAINLSKANTI